MKMKAAVRECPCGGFAVESVDVVSRALPACLDIANALIEPFVLRCLDIVLGRQTADGAGELLDLGFAPRDSVFAPSRACRRDRFLR